MSTHLRYIKHVSDVRMVVNMYIIIKEETQDTILYLLLQLVYKNCFIWCLQNITFKQNILTFRTQHSSAKFLQTKLKCCTDDARETWKLLSIYRDNRYLFVLPVQSITGTLGQSIINFQRWLRRFTLKSFACSIHHHIEVRVGFVCYLENKKKSTDWARKA